MKSICAWCKKDLDNHQPPSGDETPISHGLCPECAFHIRASGGMLLQSFLDGLKAPIVLVDGDGVVVTANGEARAMLGKTSIQINGFRGGEVFECEYAYLPEGCGSTVHCSGCTIRNTVMDTLQSGKSHEKTPAYLNQREAGRIAFLISTEKVGDYVLLRVDDVIQ